MNLGFKTDVRWQDLAVVSVLGLIFLVNKNPYFGWNDALGFAADAASGWSLDTNATSHFLYTNLLHVLFWATPFLKPAFSATLFSVICGLVTCWQVSNLVKMSGAGSASGRLSMLVWGLSFTFWQQSEGVEVYAFNCMVATFFLRFSLKDMLEGHRDNWPWVAVFFGLGILTHIQWILAIPFLGWYLISSRGKLPFWKIGFSMLIVSAVVSPLFIISVVTKNNTIAAIFFDNRFQGEVLGFSFGAFLKGAIKGGGYFIYNFHLWCLAILYGWREMFWKNHPWRWPLLIFSVPFWVFAAKYGVSDNHVFYLLGYIGIFLPIGFACQALLERGSGWKKSVWLAAVLMPFILYSTATWAIRQTGYGKNYDQEKAYKGGVTHISWPGRSWAKDPLALTKYYLKNDPEAFERGEIEWNYPDALRFLEAVGEK